eukprot:scaffold40113_cov21-Tisochrysis_lutea.AAC.1
MSRALISASHPCLVLKKSMLEAAKKVVRRAAEGEGGTNSHNLREHMDKYDARSRQACSEFTCEWSHEN